MVIGLNHTKGKCLNEVNTIHAAELHQYDYAEWAKHRLQCIGVMIVSELFCKQSYLREESCQKVLYKRVLSLLPVKTWWYQHCIQPLVTDDLIYRGICNSDDIGIYIAK